MSLKLQIRVLYACATILVMAGILVVAERIVRLNSNLQFSSKRNLPDQVRTAQPTNQTSDRVPIEQFEPLWDKRLQGRPIEPEPVVPKQPVVKEKPAKVIKPTIVKRPPPLQVQGILFSPSFSIATLSYRGGKPQPAKTGDTLEDVRVVEIGPNKVTVEYLGSEFDLGLEQ